MPTSEEDEPEKSLPLALQGLFYKVCVFIYMCMHFVLCICVHVYAVHGVHCA